MVRMCYGKCRLMSQDLHLRNTKMEAFGGFDPPSQEICEVANDLLT